MGADRYGQPVTAASPEAVRHFADFLDRFLAQDGGVDAALDRALAADPGFALAHAARALREHLVARRPLAQAAAGRATVLAPGVFARERVSVPHNLEYARDWAAQGARIIGGCCGVGPARIETLAQELPRRPRRAAPA